MVRNARVLERSSWRWSHVAKWTLAIAIAALASSATAGLVVTAPVTATDENLVLLGDAYTSITVNVAGDNVYGMAALLDEDASADIIILSPLVTNISVTADGGTGAACMFVDAGTIYTNNILGVLTATADDSAFGIGGTTGVAVVTGTISGSISVTALDGAAFGVAGATGVHIPTIDEDGSITVHATGDSATGIASATVVSMSGAMDGTITVTSNFSATGISGGEVSIDSIGGTISATSDGTATGIVGSNVTIGDISGTITASTTDTDEAYGIMADTGPLIVGNVSGAISASASGNTAYGLLATLGNATVGNISRDTDAPAIKAAAGGNDAVAIRSMLGNVTVGNINGGTIDDPAIEATAGGTDAYGIRAFGNVTTGDVNGVITATATGANAAGIRAENGDVTIARITRHLDEFGDEDHRGSIFATAADHVYGIWASGDVTIGDAIEAGTLFADGDVVSGIIDGTVAAESTVGDVAYGIYSDAGNISIESIGTSGIVSATAAGDGAIAIYANDGSVLIGDIAGTVSANAGDDGAYGIRANDGTLAIGNVSGTIEAVAGGSGAYAIANTTAGESVTIGDVTGDGLISAQATDAAYGIDSTVGEGGGDVFIGDIYGYVDGDAVIHEVAIAEEDGIPPAMIADEDGIHWATISAETTEGDHAIGIHAGGDVVIASVGTYGRITANAANDEAYGIWAGNDVLIGDVCDVCDFSQKPFSLSLEVSSGIAMDGTISATADGDLAYGIYAGGNVVIGSIGDNGQIMADALGDSAYGIHATGDVTIGDMDGTIQGIASSTAYGINAGGTVQLGDVDGQVLAYASDGDTAYGIFAGGDVITGTISGDVVATASGDDAYGIHAEGGLTTTVTGFVGARTDTGSSAVALSAVDAMDILIDGGEVSGTQETIVDDETVVTPEYAIRSGHFDGEAWVSTATVDDDVEIVAGSTIVGKIDLGDQTLTDRLTLSGTFGSTTLNEDIVNVEAIDITGGMWHINGDASQASGDTLSVTTVSGGAELFGNGTLGDLTMTNSTLEPGDYIGTVTVTGLPFGTRGLMGPMLAPEPGDSIGTLHVAGDLTLGAGTLFVPEVSNDPCHHDLVDVAGTVTIDSDPETGAAIAPTAAHFITHAMTVPVIHAGGGVTGDSAFAPELWQFTPFFDYTVGSEEAEVGEDVVLDITPADFTEYAVTKNERAVGGALNALAGEGDALDPGTQDALVQIREQQHASGVAGDNGEPALLDELLPQDALGIGQVSSAMMMGFNDNLFDRVSNVVTGRSLAMDSFGQKYLAAASNTLAAPAPKEETWAPFIRAIGSWGDMDGEKGLSGYKYNIYGLTAGADKMVDDNWLVGIGFGGATASVDYDRPRTDADIDSAFASLYGSYIKDNWHVDATLSYGHSWIDSQRGIDIGAFHSTAKNKHQADMFSLALQSGINLGDKTNIIEPIAGVGFTSMNEKGYKEKGAGALDLDVDSETTNSYYSKLGIRLATELNTDTSVRLVPEVGAFWIHDFSDRPEVNSRFATGSAFKTEGIDPAGDSFDLAGGFSAYFASDWRLFAIYDWKTSSDLSASTVRAGVQWKF